MGKKKVSFSNTKLLHRELFLTMFYSINSSPLLVTKCVFKLTSALSNDGQCPLPLMGDVTRGNLQARTIGNLLEENQFIIEWSHILGDRKTLF